VSCRLSWAGPAARPGGAAGPALAPCAGRRWRPLVVGYMRLQASDPLGRADQLDAKMRVFAHRCGHALAGMYTEQPDVSSREGAAFSAMVKALRRPHIHAVVIPSPGHFSRFDGMYRAMCTVIETATGADVLVMSARSGGAYEPA
jgi:hypothetical protein